jgi:hypothetical protein
VLDSSPVSLPSDWYILVVADGVNLEVPGIYEWRIDGVGVYIGKYGRIRRPTKEYGRNLKRMLNGKHYRSNKKDGFRGIHWALLDAHRSNRKITLTILENVIDAQVRNAREREWIDRRIREVAAGGPSVLNADRTTTGARSATSDGIAF